MSPTMIPLQPRVPSWRTEQKREPEHLVPLRCPQCGAPLSGDKCEYCDTVFRLSEANTVPVSRSGGWPAAEEG